MSAGAAWRRGRAHSIYDATEHPLRGPHEVPYGYSRAVPVGNQAHVAGTCAPPLNVEDVDAYSQAIDAFQTIANALSEAGASMVDVVRTRLYVVNISDSDDVMRAHGEQFGAIWPTATLVQVGVLIDPNLLVEIEAYAIIDE